MMSSNAEAWDKKYLLRNNLGTKQSGDDIWPVYVLLQKKLFSSKHIKNMAWRLVPDPF